MEELFDLMDKQLETLNELSVRKLNPKAEAIETLENEIYLAGLYDRDYSVNKLTNVLNYIKGQDGN